jgi:hypothetical protein
MRSPRPNSSCAALAPRDTRARAVVDASSPDLPEAVRADVAEKVGMTLEREVEWKNKPTCVYAVERSVSNQFTECER